MIRNLKNLCRHDPENGSWGDCHRTCFAAILGVEQADVPHFFDQDRGGEAGNEIADAWLAERGLVQGTVVFPGETDFDLLLQTLGHSMPGVAVILGGRSRNGTDHSVVLLAGEIVCDPTDGGIVGPCKTGFYHVTFFSPAPGTCPAALAGGEAAA